GSGCSPSRLSRGLPRTRREARCTSSTSASSTRAPKPIISPTVLTPWSMSSTPRTARLPSRLRRIRLSRDLPGITILPVPMAWWPPFPWLFVTDGGSRVVSIDLRTDAAVSDVVTRAADNNRSDELAYDPEHGLLLVINNADSPPFGTLISVNKSNGNLTVGAQIPFTDAQ